MGLDYCDLCEHFGRDDVTYGHFDAAPVNQAIAAVDECNSAIRIANLRYQLLWLWSLRLNRPSLSCSSVLGFASMLILLT